MVRSNNEKVIHNREHVFDGQGSITVRDLLNGPEEMYGKGRVFAHTTVEPNCSIGYHVHVAESETYYILDGEAEFNDNGRIVHLSAGDVAYTPAGEGHGIKNIGTQPLNLIALILYQ